MAAQTCRCLAVAALLLSAFSVRDSSAQGGGGGVGGGRNTASSPGVPPEPMTPLEWEQHCIAQYDADNKNWSSSTGKLAYDSYVRSIDYIDVPGCGEVETWTEFSSWCRQQVFHGLAFQLCVAEAAPFVVKRSSNQTSFDTGCQLPDIDDDDVLSAIENPVLSQDSTVMTLTEFVSQYTGFEVEMVMGLLHEALNDPRARVQIFPSQLAALYAMKKGSCSVLAAGLAMQSRYAATRLAADCTVRAPLDCPDPEPGETLSDKHICGISYIDIPTYSSGYSVLTKVDYVKSAFTQIIENFQAPAVVNMFCIAALGVIMVSHVMWILEREWDPARSVLGGYRQGVEEGMWWAMTTMTTVGYGDIVPYSLAGRLVAVAWMIAGMLLFSFFSAVLTSALVVESAPQYLQFNSFEDIVEHLEHNPASKFCTVESSYVTGRMVDLMSELEVQGSIVTAGSLASCYSMLASDDSEVVGVIADRPSLLYDGSTRLRSSHAPLQDNDCFEHGVVVGSALEEVPYALAVRAQYGDNSGMSHMEECCRVEQLQSVAHSLVFGAINNGLMFGSLNPSSGFMQSIRQLRRYWFGESAAIFEEVPLGQNTASGDVINIPLLCTTTLLYGFAVIAFAAGRYQDAKKMKAEVLKSTMSAYAESHATSKALTIHPPSERDFDELPRQLMTSRTRAKHHHMARLGTHLHVRSFRADSARYDDPGLLASPGHHAWRSRNRTSTEGGALSSDALPGLTPKSTGVGARVSFT